MLTTPILSFFFSVGLHPVLHGNCGTCFVHSVAAHLSGDLLLLQVRTEIFSSDLEESELKSVEFYSVSTLHAGGFQWSKIKYNCY